MSPAFSYAPRSPLQIMPSVYQLPGLWWHWCRLDQVCALVPALAHQFGHQFAPDGEDLVRRFAALVRPNRPPQGTAEERQKLPAKKIFRYSMDGRTLRGTEVPRDLGLGSVNEFRLNVDGPYPAELFVPVGWAQDTLEAIRRGAVEAYDYGEYIFGFGPDKIGSPAIRLRGPKETGMILMKLPAGLRG